MNKDYIDIVQLKISKIVDDIVNGLTHPSTAKTDLLDLLSPPTPISGNGREVEAIKDFAYKLGGRYGIHIDKYFKSHVEELLQTVCAECNGCGYIIGIDTTTGCCGNANPDGSCCGNGIPTPIQTQEPCPKCSYSPAPQSEQGERIACEHKNLEYRGGYDKCTDCGTYLTKTK